MATEAAVVILRVTIVYAMALLFLRASRQLPAQIRHLAALLAMTMAFVMLIDLPIAALAPEHPVFTVRALEAADMGGGRVSPDSVWTWAGIALLVWATGCAAVLLRFVIGSIVLRRARHRASPFGSDPRVLAADVSVPMVTGTMRAVVLMPREAANWPEVRRDAALRHEMAHVQRRDLLSNFFALAVCAVYWFHPLTWILFRQTWEEQEAACDDLVVEQGFDRAAYAEALLDVSRESRAQGILIASCPMTSGAGVKRRIVRVLSARERMTPKRSLRWQRLVLGGAMLIFGVTAAVGTEPIYGVGGAVSSPVVLRKTLPAYTNSARAAKAQGSVQLSIVVGDDGIARDIVVTRGIEPGLDRNAVAAVRAFQFRPAIRNGTPVAVHARIAVNFRLK